MMLAVSLGTLKSEISTIYLFFEAPESDESEEAGEEVEAEGDAEDTDVATGVVKPGAQGERHRVGEVPDYPQHRQHDHPLPGPGVVRDEAVGDEDEGPITKINPTLRNSTIPDDSIIIIIDDDIVYNPNVFFDLQKSVITHPTKISSMCNKNIEGFSGYAFVKKTLKGLQDLLIPKSCIRIDDFVVSSYIDHFNIGKVSVPYQNIKHAFCSMNIEKTDEHPPWKELCSGEGETKEEGKHMKKKCLLDLNNSFLEYKHL